MWGEDFALATGAVTAGSQEIRWLGEVSFWGDFTKTACHRREAGRRRLSESRRFYIKSSMAGKFAVLMAAVFMVCGRRRMGARMALVEGRFGYGQSRKLTLSSYQKYHHPLFHYGGSVTRLIVSIVREPMAPSPIFTATPSPVFITARCCALLTLTSSALLSPHRCPHNPDIIAVEFLPKRLWRQAQF